MRPRVRSYGLSSTRTRSPGSTRMRYRRILPARWARTSWPMSSFTRKFRLGRASMTSPSTSIFSSTAMLLLRQLAGTRADEGTPRGPAPRRRSAAWARLSTGYPATPPWLRERRTRDGGRQARAGAHPEHGDDARPPAQQRDGGHGQQRPLPPHLHAVQERHRRAEDRAHRGRAGAVEEGPRVAAVAQPREAPEEGQHEDERRGEGEHAGQQRAGQAVRRPADRRYRLHDRAGRELAEGDRVEELAVGHPAVPVDGVALQQRDDDEAAAVAQRPDLQRRP